MLRLSGAVIHLFPLIGCTCIITALILLSNDIEWSISKASVSKCIQDYSPNRAMKGLILIGGYLIFLSTILRNIQIDITNHLEGNGFSCKTAINLGCVVASISAYLCLILLVLFNLEGPYPANLIHAQSSSAYFILANLYAMLHMWLLWKQNQHTIFCKIAFALVMIGTISCSAIYYVIQDQTKTLEWFVVALSAFNAGMISILFWEVPLDVKDLLDFYKTRFLGGAISLLPMQAQVTTHLRHELQPDVIYSNYCRMEKPLQYNSFGSIFGLVGVYFDWTKKNLPPNISSADAPPTEPLLSQS